jgi:NAD(P)-dependent dehydrogenase (short-subunit alcohol dehydrogenase family)
MATLLFRAAGFDTNGPYSVSKYALNLMMLKYALSLKDEGFIFLSISPGVVDTSEGRPCVYLCALNLRGVILTKSSEASTETQAAFVKMLSQFRTVYPHWVKPATPQESVEQMRQVFSQLKPEHTGNFCSQFGPTSRIWL